MNTSVVFQQGTAAKESYSRLSTLHTKRIPNDCDAYLAPFKLSKDESTRSTGLSEVIRLQAPEQGGNRDTFLAFPSSSFDRLMRLQKPPEEKPHVVKEAIIPISAPPAKPRGPRGRPKGKAEEATMKPLTLPTEYMGEAEETLNQTVVITSSKPTKRGRKSEVVYDLSTENPDLYNALQEIFNGVNAEAFKIPQVEAKKPFFMQISKYNCSDFQLADYATQPCCLPMVRERFDKNQYRDASSMFADIESIFTNIATYYPNSHPAVLRAAQVKIVYEGLKMKAQQFL